MNEDNEVWPMEIVRVRLMLDNARRLLKRKYKGREVWTLVCDLTGHGSAYSIKFCEAINWNPHEKL